MHTGCRERNYVAQKLFELSPINRFHELRNITRCATFIVEKAVVGAFRRRFTSWIFSGSAMGSDRDLRDGTDASIPVRQALIPKKQPGKFRLLGIPCIRDRIAQTSAMPVLTPIFEADLQPEQFAYRPGRSARDAVRRVHSSRFTASCTGGKTRWSIATFPTISTMSRGTGWSGSSSTVLVTSGSSGRSQNG